MVGARGFEPPTPRSRTVCATRLRYAPSIRTCYHRVLVSHKMTRRVLSRLYPSLGRNPVCGILRFRRFKPGTKKTGGHDGSPDLFNSISSGLFQFPDGFLDPFEPFFDVSFDIFIRDICLFSLLQDDP